MRDYDENTKNKIIEDAKRAILQGKVSALEEAFKISYETGEKTKEHDEVIAGQYDERGQPATRRVPPEDIREHYITDIDKKALLEYALDNNTQADVVNRLLTDTNQNNVIALQALLEKSSSTKKERIAYLATSISEKVCNDFFSKFLPFKELNDALQLLWKTLDSKDFDNKNLQDRTNSHIQNSTQFQSRLMNEAKTNMNTALNESLFSDNYAELTEKIKVILESIKPYLSISNNGHLISLAEKCQNLDVFILIQLFQRTKNELESWQKKYANTDKSRNSLVITLSNTIIKKISELKNNCWVTDEIESKINQIKNEINKALDSFNSDIKPKKSMFGGQQKEVPQQTELQHIIISAKNALEGTTEAVAERDFTRRLKKPQP